MAWWKWVIGGTQQSGFEISPYRRPTAGRNADAADSLALANQVPTETNSSQELAKVCSIQSSLTLARQMILPHFSYSAITYAFALQ
jgi:hypothetical protein